MRSIFEIPVISAHAVNTFVPLIPCRELLPLMGSVDHEEEDEKVTPANGAAAPRSTKEKQKDKKPLGYIINVSSREDISEQRTDWPIAMGEREGEEAIWGRFLKHCGAVHVGSGVGRGGKA
ncbi:hypothetical protein BK809_0007837 [Diplodia seriata]|uniref:Uncharacterized protein n=1 Tax=Diplodia seriata TaxID=420778 RepID=A0A1S8BKG4_9PEZI|nr:hypothetical protein BK809_0007837 [Diplodia seriata]